MEDSRITPVFPRILEPPPSTSAQSTDLYPPISWQTIWIKDYWGEEAGGGHKAFSSTLEGVMKIMTKKYTKKGVERAKKHSEGGQTTF